MPIKIGNTRYDTMAGLGPTMRLVAKIGAEVSDPVFSTDYAKNQAAIGVLDTFSVGNRVGSSVRSLSGTR